MNIYLSLFLTLILVFIAIYKKALTKPALVLSGLCSFIISTIGGYPCFIILALTFVLAELASFFHRKDCIKNNINQKHGKRDIVQILVNVVPATIVIIIYYFTRNNLFLIGYSTIMGEVLADTLGSDIGILSHKNPINIITFKKGTPGLSGNVSLLGLISEFFGGFIVGLIYYIFIDHNIFIMFLIVLSSFLGGLVDSILGASVQVKYRCKKCNIVTERMEHCGIKTKYYSGIRFINNDIVNLLSSLFSFLIVFVLNLLV